MAGRMKVGAEILLKRDQVLIRDAQNTDDFIRQFAPLAPRRRAEFVAALIVLIDAHCVTAEQEGSKIKAREMGSKGGEKGGLRRAESLSPEQRKTIARKAANARWHNQRDRASDAIEMIGSFLSKRGYAPSRRALAKHFNCSLATASRYLKAAATASAPTQTPG